MTEYNELYLKESGILSQNCDWAKDLEPLTVILKIKKKTKPEIIQIAEPGIIGKIGMNDAGLGVCLNFLHIEKEYKKQKEEIKGV